MWLVDTNVWLEVLLNQERAPEAERFLKASPDRLLAISEFSLSSIGLILTDAEAEQAFQAFVEDTFIEGNVERLVVPSETMTQIPAIMNEEGLDFDDAYQYEVARSFGLSIVSFDDDFDGTDVQRLRPEDVLDEIADEGT